jgi:hypothetical protein
VEAFFGLDAEPFKQDELRRIDFFGMAKQGSQKKMYSIGRLRYIEPGQPVGTITTTLRRPFLSCLDMKNDFCHFCFFNQPRATKTALQPTPSWARAAPVSSMVLSQVYVQALCGHKYLLLNELQQNT